MQRQTSFKSYLCRLIIYFTDTYIYIFIYFCSCAGHSHMDPYIRIRENSYSLIYTCLSSPFEYNYGNVWTGLEIVPSPCLPPPTHPKHTEKALRSGSPPPSLPTIPLPISLLFLCNSKNPFGSVLLLEISVRAWLGWIGAVRSQISGECSRDLNASTCGSIRFCGAEADLLLGARRQMLDFFRGSFWFSLLLSCLGALCSGFYFAPYRVLDLP